MVRIGLFLFAVAGVVGFFAIDFKVTLETKPLLLNETVYAGRPYILEGDLAGLSGARLVLISRYHKAPVTLSMTAPAQIARLLSEVNPNTEFSDWIPMPVSAYVLGSNFEGNKNHLTVAVSKQFAAGEIERWRQTLKNRILRENYFLPRGPFRCGICGYSDMEQLAPTMAKNDKRIK